MPVNHFQPDVHDNT